MSAEIKEEVKGMGWLPWICLTAVLSVVFNIVHGMAGVGGWGCIYGLGTISLPFSLPVLMLVLPMLAYPITLTKRFKEPTVNLARLSIIGLMVSMTMSHYGGTAAWNSVPAGYINRIYDYSSMEVESLLSRMWFVPPRDVVRAMRIGGIMPDWGAWSGAMFFVFAFQFSFFVLGLGLMSLFRYRWIEVERVPFPVPLITWRAVSYSYRLAGVKTRVPFILGLLVGFFVNFQILMTYVFPWWPDILGWRANGISPIGCATVNVGYPTWVLGSQIVAFMRWNMQPFNYIIAYLAPLDVSFGMWFCTMIMMLLAQIAYYFGYYTGILDLGGCCRVLGFAGYKLSPTWGPPLYWNWLCLTGGMLAFVFITIWQGRSYLIETFKLARRGEKSEREPFSYRTIYAIILIGMVLVTLFLCSVGIGVGIALLIMFFGGIIYAIAEAYARGLAGICFGQGRDMWPTWPLRFLIWPRAPERYSVEWIMAITIISDGLDQQAAGVTTWTTTAMYGFTLANMAGIGSKEAVKFMVMAFLVSLPISLILRIWFVNFVGATRAKLCTAPWDCDICGFDRYNTAPPVSEIAIAAMVGFVVTMLLSFARMRFIWWPIHPIGYLFSGGMYITWTGAWSCFLVAWITKWLTLRIGGSKAYEEYGVPFVAGALVGLAINILLAIVMAVVRFFIPF